jgi:hypothetical protein
MKSWKFRWWDRQEHRQFYQFLADGHITSSLRAFFYWLASSILSQLSMILNMIKVHNVIGTLSIWFHNNIRHECLSHFRNCCQRNEIDMRCFVLQDLRNILALLRDHHHYCLYCGCKVSSFLHEIKIFSQYSSSESCNNIPYLVPQIVVIYCWLGLIHPWITMWPRTALIVF